MKTTVTRLTNKFFLALILLSITMPAFSPASHTVQAQNSAQLQTATALAKGAADSTLAMDWRITGPSGGDVRALVVDPNDPQRFYFGTLDGQIYISVDGGEQWRLLYNFNVPKLFVDHIAVDPRDSNVLYVATHRHKDPGGFFKSSDGGRTWRAATELKNEALHSLTQSTKNPDIIVVGTNTGIYRSSDSGDSWVKLPTSATPGLQNVESLAIDPRNADVIYAGTWYLPYKTTDGGSTWKIIKNGIIDDSDIFAIDIDQRNPDHVIASACSGIYETQSAGENWRKVQGIPSQSRRTRAILQHPSLSNIVFAGTTEGLWRSLKGGNDGSWMVMTPRTLEINSIAIHPSNPQNILIGTNNYGVMISHDAGKTFAPSNGGYSGRFVNSILPDREMPNRVYATTINTATGGGFFFVSNDGGASWQPSTRNMQVNRLISYSILQDVRDANILYLGTNLGVYRSLDRGASWSPLGAPKVEPTGKKKRGRRGSAPTAPKAGVAAAVAKRSDEMVKRAQESLNAAGFNVGTPDGAAGARTVAAIRKFQAAQHIPVSGDLDVETLTALGLAGGVQTTSGGGKIPMLPVYLADAVNALAHTTDEQGNPGILAATNAGLFRTFDAAQGWEKISFGSNFDSRTTCISLNSENPQTIWVGTATSGVLVSRDGGATWQQIEGIPANAPISTIEQDPKRSAYIYVGTKQTLYYSHDGGAQWTRRGGNLPYGEYASILVNPRNGDEVIVGNAYENQGGVYRSLDAGQTWQRIDPREGRLPSQRIWALAFDANNPNKIFVGSHSAGVYVAERGASAAASIEK